MFKSDVFSVSLTSWHCARYPDLCDYCSVSSSPLSLFLFVEVCPAQGWWVFRQQSKTFTRTIQNSWAKCFIKFTQSHIQIYKGRKISVIIKLIQASPRKVWHLHPVRQAFIFHFPKRRYSFESITINNLVLRENSSKGISNFTVLKWPMNYLMVS